MAETKVGEFIKMRGEKIIRRVLDRFGERPFSLDEATKFLRKEYPFLPGNGRNYTRRTLDFYVRDRVLDSVGDYFWKWNPILRDLSLGYKMLPEEEGVGIKKFFPRMEYYRWLTECEKLKITPKHSKVMVKL